MNLSMPLIPAHFMFVVPKNFKIPCMCFPKMNLTAPYTSAFYVCGTKEFQNSLYVLHKNESHSPLYQCILCLWYQRISKFLICASQKWISQPLTPAHFMFVVPKNFKIPYMCFPKMNLTAPYTSAFYVCGTKELQISLYMLPKNESHSPLHQRILFLWYQKG
jgi:hypothetical protein